MNWTHLLLQANIYLVVFYAFYKLLLERETYFILNRIYLVSAGLLSFILPFIRLDWFSSQSVAQPVYESFGQLNQLMTEVTTTQVEANAFSLGRLLALVYLAGVLLLTVRFGYQLLRLKRILNLPVHGTAFSFFKKTVIDAELPQADTIRQHENVHSRQYHSADILLMEVLTILNWFNPVISYYRRSIRSIHEYLADDQAARHLGNKETYALLLVSNALGVSLSNLTNNFSYQPLLKKRIYMLNQKRSPKTALLKYGLFAPLFGLSLMLSSATLGENSNLKALSNQIPLEESLAIPSALNPIQDPWKDFYAHLARTVPYPVNKKTTTPVSTTIRLTLKDGGIENIGTTGKPLGGGVDASVMAAVLNYKKVDALPQGNYLLTINFQETEQAAASPATTQLNGYKKLDPVNIIKANKVYDFIAVEKAPTFPGGMQKFYTYLKNNIKYPAEAKANQVDGKVFLSFIVEADGSLKNIQVDRKLGYGTDEEAIRVLEASPKWEPGIYHGQAVRVKYNIPIRFNTNPVQKDSVTIKSVKGNAFTAAEGSKFNLKTASAKDPLFYVDGVKTTKATMAALNPNAIESITVLKDESAKSLYGDEGKDGVVLIITKTKKLNEITIPNQEKN